MGRILLAASSWIVLVAADLPRGAITADDVERSSQVEANFAYAAENDKPDVLLSAMNVCRIAYSEALSGKHLTSDFIANYKGKRADVLSLVCNGYLQGASDTLHGLPLK